MKKKDLAENLWLIRWRIYENSYQYSEISTHPQNQLHCILRKALTLRMHLNRNLKRSKIQKNSEFSDTTKDHIEKSPITTSTSSVSSNNIFTYGLDFESVPKSCDDANKELPMNFNIDSSFLSRTETRRKFDATERHRFPSH